MKQVRCEPVGGPLMTPFYRILLAIGAVGILAIIWRFAVGLGASTALSDGYPWGLWIAFDVVTGTALACGGYAVALLVYIFNKGHYHPLVRPALLTSAIGYTLAGLAVAIDVGRPWLLWKVPLFVWHWNKHSVLLEVAVCIMAYTLVLWIELSPAFFEKWAESGREGLRRFSQKAAPFIDRILIAVVALGIVLPTMHQSSLGSLMLIAGPKLNPIWRTGFLPLFYLMTCLAMGYAVVVFESTFAARAFGRDPETEMIAKLGRIAAWVTLVFVAMRFADLIMRGVLGLTFQPTIAALLFWVETILFVAPFVMVLRGIRDSRSLLWIAGLVGFAGALYRFDTFLAAFDPGPGWHYFPSVGETLITLGLISIEIAVYIALVKRFPILSGRATTSSAH